MGKALGLRIAHQLPQGIYPHDLGVVTQAACLAHDIGNPPFGHAGEEAMLHWFELNGSKYFGNLSREHRRDLMSFEGNAQGFRIITQTENHLFDGGLRLTYATLGTFLKYPWSSRVPGKKFGAYITEERILEDVAGELGLVKGRKYEWSRHPLAHLVEAADDICYAIIDLEDAVELRILSFEQVQDLLFELFPQNRREEIDANFASKSEHRVNLARLRGPVFESVVSGAIDAFMKGYESIMEGKFKGNLLDLLDEDDPRRTVISKAKQLSATSVFPDQKKIEIELGSYSTLECLLDACCRAAVEVANHLKSPRDETILGWKSSLVLRLLSDHAPNESNHPPNVSWSPYQCLRRVIDFISGMTDNYATYIAKQLQGMAFAGLQRP